MSDWFLDTAHPMRSGSPAAPLPAVARQLPVLAEA
jgi:hypothetical protein